MFDKTKVVIRPVNETISCELETKFKDVDDIITFDENQKLFLVKENWSGLTVGLYLFEFQSFGSSIIDLENLKKSWLYLYFFNLKNKILTNNGKYS